MFSWLCHSSQSKSSMSASTQTAVESSSKHSVRTYHATTPHRLPTEGYSKDLPLCSVTLTIVGGGSYDHLFQQVRQRPPTPDVALALWEIDYQFISSLLSVLKADKPHALDKIPEKLLSVLNEIHADLKQVDPSVVLVNFECCGGCSESGFPIPAQEVYAFISYFLKRGSVLQFGDFSTKALIHTWDTSVLGRNPFKQIGTFSTSFELRFDPYALITGPSAQLKIVGELCRDSGLAKLRAMSGTVQFTVDNNKAEGYQLKVLSVMTSAGNAVVKGNETVKFQGKTHRGGIGHAWLKYPVTEVATETSASAPSLTEASKTSASTSSSSSSSSSSSERFGQLIISAGHWIELNHLDTNFENVKKQMAARYGAAEAENFVQNYRNMRAEEQSCYVQKQGAQILQSAGLL